MSPITLDDPPAYFARLADFEANHWWSAMTWRIAGHWLDAIARGRSGLRALDVGSGAGLTLSRLAARSEIGRVVGVDPSPEALALARRQGLVVAGSAVALPFATGSFDLATCFDVLQHLPTGADRRASRELARVLARGGRAILRTNAGRGGLDLDRLRETVEAAGLRVVRASRVNWVGSLAQEVRGRLRPARHRAHPGGGGLPGPARGEIVARVMGSIGRAEALAVGRLGWNLPFGHSAMLLVARDGARPE